MPTTRKSRVPTGWLWALAFVAFVVGLLAYLRQGSTISLDNLDKLSSVGSLAVGLAGLAVSALALRGAVRPGSETGLPADEAQRSRAVRGLADAIRRQWTAESAARRVSQPAPLGIRWALTARPVQAELTAFLPASVGTEAASLLRMGGDLQDAVAVYRSLPRGQLVVLGEPGAGKTVFAILLTLALLEDRRLEDAVPVLLAASSWNPPEETLYEWVARRVTEDYPALADARAYGPDAVHRLIEGGSLLPVIDGLDEMPAEMHTAAIVAIDHGAGGRPVVVTCRGAEYERAVAEGGRVMSGAAVIELLPSVVDDVIAFLSGGRVANDPQWTPLYEEMWAHPDGPLANALSTPLMASLVRSAYSSQDPRELLDGRFHNSAAIQLHLLDTFVPSAYPRPGLTQAPAQRVWPERSVPRWLGFLARHLRRLDSRDLAWWQLVRTVSWPVRTLLVGVPVVVPLAAGAALAVRDGAGIGPILWAVLTVGLLVASSVQPAPSRTVLGIRGRVGRVVVLFLFAIAIGVVGGLAIGLVIRGLRLPFGLTSGVGIGLGFVLAIVLLSALARPIEVGFAVSPDNLLKVDRRYALSTAFVYVVLLLAGDGARRMVIMGTEAGLRSWLVGPWTWYVAWFLLIAGGLIGWVMLSAWGRWLVLGRFWLPLTGRLPWRTIEFLDDACRRGVLRRVGGVYQFRHARLQDRLARVRDDGRSGQPTERSGSVSSSGTGTG